jgi:cell division septation protein DedD
MIMGHMGADVVMMTPGLDNLHIITSGPIPPNPAELIDSEHLTNFLEEAKEDYDTIIFDSPPILSTADAAILAAKVDGVLLVYRVGAVSRGLLRRSKAQLDRVHCDLMGVVLNGMKADVSPDFQDYKYYSYNYAYGEEKKNKKRLGHVGNAFRNQVRGGLERVSQMVYSENKGIRSTKKKLLNRVNLALVLLAAILLTIGILWQGDNEEPSKSSVLQPPVGGSSIEREEKRESEKETIGKKGEILTPGTKSDVYDAPPTEIETPILESTTLKKQEDAVEIPMAKEETHQKSFVRIEQEKAPPKPGNNVNEEQSKLEKIAAVTETMMDEKQKLEPETTISLKEAYSFPYSILVSHVRSVRNAEEVISQYEKRDLASYWVKVELSNGIWYRVYIGSFKNRLEAENFREGHGLEESRVMKTEYANLIGLYTSSEELQSQIGLLKELGYSPYVIEDQNGESRLFIGAFLTKEGAESQYQDLKSSGIESRIIKR